MKSAYEQIKASINLDNFLDYYQTHNIKETAKHFNISIDRVTQICKDLGFKKTKAQIVQQIQDTKINNFGSDNNLNAHNKAKRDATLIEKCGSLEAAKQARIDKLKKTKAKNPNSFAYIIQRIDKDEFIDLYINQNKSRTYIKKHFDISEYILDRVIEHFDAHKPRKLSADIGLQCKYEKFGSKDNYFTYLTAAVKETKIKHFGSWEAAKAATSCSCKETWGQKSTDELEQIKARTVNTNMQKYGVACCYQLPSCRLKGNNSKPNLEFTQVLQANNIQFEREFPLLNRSYDFKIGNILIEIDPSATHNSTYGIYDSKPLDAKYHAHKSQLARDYGYRCIHIWDWDDKEKIIENLKVKNRLYARNCVIKNLDKDITNDFLNQYHLQGACRNQDIRLGLYHNDILVQVMTFGKPRYNHKFDYELLRLCTRSDLKIIGGAEKLFKHFLNTWNPKSIISYCDLSKFNGDVYSRLNFTCLKKAQPSKHWYNMKKNYHILDSSLRVKGFDILLGKDFGYFGKGTNNEQLMLQSGFVEIYDCGQAAYAYINNN